MGNDKIETDKYTVYFEDCISGMKKYIPDNSIDFIITDPPYGVGKDFEKDIDLNYTIRASFLELFKKLKNNKFFTYTCSPCPPTPYKPRTLPGVQRRIQRYSTEQPQF